MLALLLHEYSCCGMEQVHWVVLNRLGGSVTDGFLQMEKAVSDIPPLEAVVTYTQSSKAEDLGYR